MSSIYGYDNGDEENTDSDKSIGTEYRTCGHI